MLGFGGFFVAGAGACRIYRSCVCRKVPRNPANIGAAGGFVFSGQVADVRFLTSRAPAALRYAALALLVYVVMAYAVLPLAWTHYEHQKDLSGQPMQTRTADGIPGDPINIGLVGTKEDVLCAMRAAGWSPADPRTLWSSLEIADSVVFDRPYRDAPVSPLFYDGRREDLAFEKAAGTSAGRRHHVRFWQVLEIR